LGTTEAGTDWIVQVSAMLFSVPAVPELIVPDKLRIGEPTTAEDFITPVPACPLVPEALVTTTVVVVDAVTVKVPLFPVSGEVNPETIIDAPTHPLEPAPVSVAMV